MKQDYKRKRIEEFRREALGNREDFEKELADLPEEDKEKELEGYDLICSYFEDFLLASMEEAERQTAEDINNKNLSYMESCEPDCDEVRHARHEGSWQHYWNMDRYIEVTYLQHTEEKT